MFVIIKKDASMFSSAIACLKSFQEQTVLAFGLMF